MKRIRVAFTVAGLLVGATALLVAAAGASQASWVGSHCSPSHSSDSIFQRKTSQSYAAVAVGEGYEWGGGCWNDNDRDDTPGAPDSGGEGPDCSGFTFKTWELKNSYGTSGGEYWDKLENIHGPYVAADFHSTASSDPFHNITKSDTSMQYMDAFASTTHVAMKSSTSDSSSNSDYVYEAKADSSGTGLFYEGYMGSSSYTAAAREGWTADCYPNCGFAHETAILLP
jgi:hypothetical protein